MKVGLCRRHSTQNKSCCPGWTCRMNDKTKFKKSLERLSCFAFIKSKRTEVPTSPTRLLDKAEETSVLTCLTVPPLRLPSIKFSPLLSLWQAEIAKSHFKVLGASLYCCRCQVLFSMRPASSLFRRKEEKRSFVRSVQKFLEFSA